VFLCQRDLQKAKEWKIGKDHQHVVIPNAIIPEAPAQKGALRKELGIPESVKIVGNVARLDPQKNPIRFLEVAKSVLRERNDVVFVWIGANVVDDVYGEKVRRWLKKPAGERKSSLFTLQKGRGEVDGGLRRLALDI